MQSGSAVSLRAQKTKNLAWPEDADEILLEGLLDKGTAYERAIQRMRELHPKLKLEAIRKRLRPKPAGRGVNWTMSAFWKQEVDFALIGGILGGVEGKRAVIQRIHNLWPRLDSGMLRERLEALADHGTPPWAKPEFWTGTLREILLGGVEGGFATERKAINKILRLHPEIRPAVVMAQLRRVRDELRRAEGRLGQRFPWASDLLNRLREACDTRGVTAGVTQVQSETGWPRDVILRKAHQLLGIEVRKRCSSQWTASERRYIIEHANHMSTQAMAKELRRSVESVVCKMKHLGLPTGREEGFTISKLAAEWHVRRATIRLWITLDWLKRGKDGRVPERSVRSFCKKHKDELDWGRLEAYTRAWVLEFSGWEDEAEENASAAGMS